MQMMNKTNMKAGAQTMKPIATMPKMGAEMSEETTETDTTVLSSDQYPELQGAKEGDPVSGKWEGAVEKVDGTNVTVKYSSMELTTENKATKELNRITGKSSATPMMEDVAEE